MKDDLAISALSSAFTTLAALAVAGGGAAGNLQPQITVAGSLLGAVGGAIGGFMLVTMVQLKKPAIDKALAVILSAMMGFAFAPITAIFIGYNWGWWNPVDPATRIPVGAAYGALMPLAYPIVGAILYAARDNPVGLIDLVRKALEAMPTIRIGQGKDGEQ